MRLSPAGRAFCVIALHVVGPYHTALCFYHKNKNPAEPRKPLQEGDAPRGCICLGGKFYLRLTCNESSARQVIIMELGKKFLG
jgi:hypothetical protein